MALAGGPRESPRRPRRGAPPVDGDPGERRIFLPALFARPYRKECGGTSASQCKAGAAQHALSKGVGFPVFIQAQPTQTASPYTNEEGSSGKTLESVLRIARNRAGARPGIQKECQLSGARVQDSGCSGRTFNGHGTSTLPWKPWKEAHAQFTIPRAGAQPQPAE